MVQRIILVLIVTGALAAPAGADSLAVVNDWGGVGPADGQLTNLVDVAVGPNGDVYTMENGGAASDRVQRFDAAGRFLGKTGSEGRAPGQFNQPWSIAVGGDGVVYALDTFLDRVTRFSGDLSSLLGTWGSSGFGPGQFRNPEGITVSGNDVVFIADRANNQVDRYTATGTPVVEWGGLGSANDKFNRVIEVTTGGNGDVFAVDRDNNLVKRFTATGTYVRSYGLGQGIAPGQLQSPVDVAVDKAGNVWVADISDFRIEEYAGTGEFVANFDKLGARTFRPEGLAFGPNGDLYVADASNSRVWRVRPGAQGGALPAPTAGKTGNASVVSGTVLVRLPGTGRFVKLTDARAIPVGSQLDTKRGTLKLTVALRKSGGTASARLSGGRFLFGQKSGSGKLRTDLTLKGGSFSSCPKANRASRARRRTIRYLRAKATGRFNVIGKNSSGVERGTTWTTTDTCTGTVTKVTAGSVAVRDFRRGKTVIVRAGHSYQATPGQSKLSLPPKQSLPTVGVGGAR